MKNRTAHIFRSVTIFFLMAGFLAHLTVPFSSHAQKTAFTRWLDHNVIESGNESEIRLRNTIRELSEQTGDFWVLVQEASELITSHQDLFKILVKTSGQSSEEPMPSWLIDQWNVFQSQKSGFHTVLTEHAKVFSNWIPQNSGFLSTSGNFSFSHLQQEVVCHFTTGIKKKIAPLISGISINAP